jgi:hypothetical protein
MPAPRALAFALLLAGIACSTGSPEQRLPSWDAEGTACVDPIADAWRRLSDDGSIEVGTVSASDGPDLDGDGIADLIVDATGACGSGGCGHQLYVREGACARYVGELSGNEVIPTGERHRGFADLETAFGAGIGWGEFRASLHDDGEYHPDLERSCKAPSLGPGVPEDPICSDWRPAGEESNP